MLNTSHYFSFILTLLLISCNSTLQKTEYGPATKELISMIEKNPEVKAMLLSSIEKARQINPDRNTNPAQNLEEYYQFVIALV